MVWLRRDLGMCSKVLPSIAYCLENQFWLHGIRLTHLQTEQGFKTE